MAKRSREERETMDHNVVVGSNKERESRRASVEEEDGVSGEESQKMGGATRD